MLKFIRSTYTVIFLLLYFILLTTACSTQPSETKTTISFMVFGDPAEQAAFKGVVNGFHATTPNIQVEIVALPNKQDYMAKLSTDFAAGTAPDVFLLNYRRIAQFYNHNTLEALGPWLIKSKHLDESDYYPIAIEAFKDSQGTLVCMPQNISSQVVYYNKDLFDAANIPYPNPQWTWEDFRQTAIALTIPDSNFDGEAEQYGLGLEPRIIRMASFIWQNNGVLIDNQTQPTHFTLDSSEAIEAMQFVSNLSLSDQVVPSKTAEQIQTHADRFLSGNIAMYINSRRIVPIMREVVEFNWDVAPLPKGKKSASVLHSDGYCMAASSTQKQAAWQFIEFALGETGQKLASQLGRTVPSLKHVAESEAFLDPAHPPANAQVWLDAVPTLQLLPRLENWAEIERVAAIEFELVYLGQQPLELAVGHIQKQANEQFVPLK